MRTGLGRFQTGVALATVPHDTIRLSYHLHYVRQRMTTKYWINDLMPYATLTLISLALISYLQFSDVFLCYEPK